MNLQDAIMINVPAAFFKEKMTLLTFCRFYKEMNKHEDYHFYHFIATIPRAQVCDIYICAHGRVVLKAKIVEFLRNEVVEFEDGPHGPRNWVITTGPVVFAPHRIEQKGFRGFRYTQQLF